MQFKAFQTLLQTTENPVVILEGTRQTTPDDERGMTRLAAELASRFPSAVFRSGNAPGSDAAFAAGVASVDATRLQLVVPYASHRTKERPDGSQVLALESASNLDEVRRLTLEGSPIYQALAKKTSKDSQIKFTYLLRDTLKITGDAQANFAPATVGIFFVNMAKPTQGGTAHTMRVCEALNVEVVIQEQWLLWDL